MEFAHIYGHQELSDGHLESATRAQEVLAEHRGIKYTCALIDDYNSDAAGFDLDAYRHGLMAVGISPDVICSEAALAATAKAFLPQIRHGRTRRSLERYRASSGKWPCSMLTAAWYGVRLGLFEPPAGLLIHGDSDDLQGDALINILDERFLGVELEALRLLAETGNDCTGSVRFIGLRSRTPVAI